MGDNETAHALADQARQFTNFSIIVGIVSYVFLFIFLIIYYTVILF